MTIVDICGYGDFDMMYSDGIFIHKQPDLDINALNKEFIRELAEKPTSRFIVANESMDSMTLFLEGVSGAHSDSEMTIYFKDNSFCNSLGRQIFTNDEYKKFLVEKGFEPLKTVKCTINLDM